MSTQPGDANGNRATVAVVDAKVDGLKDLIRAEFKDQARRLDELSGLEPRVRELELNTVRRIGPIIDELRGFEQTVRTLTAKVDDLAIKSVSADQVRVALKFERDQQTERQSTAFSKKEKVLGLFFAAALLGLNVFQALHNL